VFSLMGRDAWGGGAFAPRCRAEKLTRGAKFKRASGELETKCISGQTERYGTRTGEGANTKDTG